MRPKTANRVVTFQREDTEDRLRDFITSNLSSVITDAGGDRVPLRLVARSSASPVARILVALASEIAREGLSVRIILANIEVGDDGEAVAHPEAPIAFEREVRWARDPRLADAHEQLLIGSKAIWVGDCMRREPGRRDAFEMWASNDVVLARSAQVAFEHLWQVAEPRFAAGSRVADVAPHEVAADAGTLAQAALLERKAATGAEPRRH